MQHYIVCAASIQSAQHVKNYFSSAIAVKRNDCTLGGATLVAFTNNYQNKLANEVQLQSIK